MKTLSDMTEPELDGVMRKAASKVESCLPKNTRFVLIAWDKDQELQFISNCQWHNTIGFLRECADRLESREDVTR